MMSTNCSTIIHHINLICDKGGKKFVYFGEHEATIVRTDVLPIFKYSPGYLYTLYLGIYYKKSCLSTSVLRLIILID